MTLYFVYASTPDSPNIQSPHARTKNLYKFFKERTNVVYHQWDAQIALDLKPDDVILGHPHYGEKTVMQQVFRRNQECAARCLIHPFHHKRVQDNMPFDFMARQADIIFSICGPYWYDTIDITPFAHWKPKIIRLDSAIDPVHFPFLRTESGSMAFNPPGKRKMIYIGNDSPNKNLRYLAEIMKLLPDVELHWFGGHGKNSLAALPNVRYTGWQILNEKVATDIVAKYDLMITVGISDANPTTLIESRAWGLITACTKESGYHHDPFFTELYTDDISKTVAAIRELLNAPSDQLYKRAVESRFEVDQRYTWRNVCDIVWSKLSPYLK